MHTEEVDNIQSMILHAGKKAMFRSCEMQISHRSVDQSGGFEGSQGTHAPKP